LVNRPQKKIAKSSVTQPQIVLFRSNLEYSLIVWPPIYYKRSTSRGQRSRSQRDVTPAKIINFRSNPR